MRPSVPASCAVTVWRAAASPVCICWTCCRSWPRWPTVWSRKRAPVFRNGAPVVRPCARVWLGQELAEPAAGRLDLVPGLLEELERRHILLEDVDGAVAAVEAEKAYFVDAESGHRLGAWRPRNVTFWVEYTEEGGRWLLHDAWCHRMRVPGSGGVQENGCCGEA